MKNIRLLFKSAVFVLPLSMSAAVCDYKLSFDKSMIDFGDVSSVKKMSVKLTNESIGDSCDLNVFQLYSTKQGQGVFSNSDFSGTIAQNSSIDIEVTITPNYTDSIIKYEDSDLFVHSVGVDSDGKKHYVKSWVDYRAIELPKQNIEVINGYTLPPEPYNVVNNSTLIGIDTNNNGVRDDVERMIIKKYPKKLHVELLMDEAKQLQKIMEQPTGNASEIQKEISRVVNCYVYLRRIDSDIKSDDWMKTNDWIDNITFNTNDRAKKYLDYNVELSGGVYGSKSSDWEKKSCSLEIIEALEEMGL